MNQAEVERTFWSLVDNGWTSAETGELHVNAMSLDLPERQRDLLVEWLDSVDRMKKK